MANLRALQTGKLSRGYYGFLLVVNAILWIAVLSCSTLSASAEEIYRFERMWPTLQQPWYFNFPAGIARDESGNIYIVDQKKYCIQKFTPDGLFIAKWGGQGSEDGQFKGAWGIAVDKAGYIYVADSENNRIQKFTSDGRFIAKWDKHGNGNGEFSRPSGIAIDVSGYVYVLDAGNHRVQKFTPEGRFLRAWGEYGSDNSQFVLIYPDSGNGVTWLPTLAVDASGNVYVADIGNHRIQKFTSDGDHIVSWGGLGSGEGRFIYPTSVAVDSVGNAYVVDLRNQRIQKFTSNGEFIAILCGGAQGVKDGYFNFPWGMVFDSSGNVYVTDTFNGRIQKLSPGGAFITKWSDEGTAPGFFLYPMGLAMDGDLDILVTDYGNGRIQKFSPDGRFLLQWGQTGSGNGNFRTPWGIAVDAGGYIYVADSGNNRIQKFSPGGEYLLQWGSQGSMDGQLRFPAGIAVDANGNVYVADYMNHRVQKFSSEGVFITQWGKNGKSDGFFEYPSGIAAGKSGNVYVSDNTRIQKFSSDGQFIASWGSYGTSDGQLNMTSGLASDESENLYVTDTGNYRIQKFSSTGEFLEKWSGRGSEPGFMLSPSGISVGANGKVYVAEMGNNRIQLFNKIGLASKSKAIIVAGGGSYEGNYLWNATRMSATFAYRTLAYQGFTKDRIHYLSSDTDLDLDDNGLKDDVDGDATRANLKRAITSWARGAEDVIIYLTDHGGKGVFRMSRKEILSAVDLASWLNTLQSSITGRLIIIYDACRSGSFLSRISSSAPGGRIVLTSTSPNENAYFINHGSISFSGYLWTNIFNGMNLFASFKRARKAIGSATDYQHPLLDDNGNGIGNDASDGILARQVFIGNGTGTLNGSPTIGEVSPEQTIIGTNTALIYADEVLDSDGVARVWGVVRPPNFNSDSTTAGSTITGLPIIDLNSQGLNRFEGTYGGFSVTGTYQIAIYAMDRIGNISIPKLTTVSVNSPLSRKAILVAGGSQSDPLWPAIEKSMKSAYESLRYQGYRKEDIYLMSPASIPGVDKETVLSNLKNLRFAVKTWARGKTRDLVLFMIGNGTARTFKINAKERLSAKALKGWLDTLQEYVPGPVTAVYDASRSGSFLSALIPPAGKKRVFIASTGEMSQACFVSGGEISFSRFFWNQVANGANLREAFLQAKTSIRYTYPKQIAALDDNGNGVGNERTDGELARGITLGAGIVLAGDPPVIGSVSPKQTLAGKRSAPIRAKDLTSTSAIKKVWAVIKPPDYRSGSPFDTVTDLPVVVLKPLGKGLYHATYRNFTAKGTYNIAVYAMDKNGSISLPLATRVYQSVGGISSN